MAAVKKVKGTTLMETLVATVLIVIVFMISSLILNTLLKVHFQNDTREIREHLEYIEYRIKNQAIKTSILSDYSRWTIRQINDTGNPKGVVLEATDQQSQRRIIHAFIIP